MNSFVYVTSVEMLHVVRERSYDEPTRTILCVMFHLVDSQNERVNRIKWDSMADTTRIVYANGDER